MPSIPVFDPRFWDHLLAGLYLIALPLLARRSQARAKEASNGAMTPRDKITVYVGNSVSLWFIAAPVGLLWWLYGRPWPALGFGPLETQPAAWGLFAALLALLAADTAWQLRSPGARSQTRERWHRDTPFMPANASEALVATLLALSAAVTEEATYRGFLLGWAVSTFGATGTVLAIAIATSGLIFGLMHGYQERSRQLKIMVLSIGFGILYVVSGSLWLPILLHALIDLSMNWIGIPIMAGSGEREQATG